MTACSMAVTSSRTLIFIRLQVEQQVDHDLAGAVVGDLAAAVDLDDRECRYPVRRCSGLPAWPSV
jgi:hypothetical protein